MSPYHERRGTSVETIERHVDANLHGSKQCGARSPRTARYTLNEFDSEHWIREQNSSAVGKRSGPQSCGPTRELSDAYGFAESYVVERRQSSFSRVMRGQDSNHLRVTNSTVECATGSGPTRNNERGWSPHTSVNGSSSRTSVSERSNLTLRSLWSVSFASDVEQTFNKIGRARSSRSHSGEDTLVVQAGAIHTENEHTEEESDPQYPIPVSGRSVSWGDDSVYEIQEDFSDDDDGMDLEYFGAAPGLFTDSNRLNSESTESWTNDKKVCPCSVVDDDDDQGFIRYFFTPLK